MVIQSIKYILANAVMSLYRNIWLSLASVITVAISLIILGYSILFLANTTQIASTFESQVEVAVFMQHELKESQVVALKSQIESLEGVAKVLITSPNQALLELQESMGTTSLLEDLGNVNPFPYKLTIQATDVHYVEGIANQVTSMEGVRKVRYGQGILEKLIGLTQWLRWVGIGVVAAFSFASFLLITLNIKTNVNTREKEIRIMRLVGASNAFIRWPFIIEGLLIGLLGALLSILVVATSYNNLMQYIISSLAFVPVVNSQAFILHVLLIMLAYGVIMGTLASGFSLRRFLKI